MNSKAKEILFISVLVVTGLYFLVVGLMAAKGFLAPLSIAILLGMILIPFSNWLEGNGFGRGWAAFVSVVLTMFFFAILSFVVALQVKNVVDEWPQIQERMKPKIEQLQEWIADKTGVDPGEQEQMVKEKIPGESSGSESSGQKQQEEDASGGAAASGGGQSKGGSQTSRGASPQSQSSGGGGMLSSLGGFVLGFFSFLGNMLLTFIYIFFILLYRRKLRKSILKFFPKDKREGAHKALSDSVELSQAYLLGRMMLIGFLIAIYTVGLSISGVKNAFLISVIAAFLSLLPYIGNVLGYGLAMGMAAFSGGDAAMFIGVTITFTIAQFIESYILEPYVVGQKVDLNPLMTILVVVVGGAVWGIVGMVISIPLFGILKILFDRISVLRPLGYTLGEEDIEFHEEENFIEKAMRKAREKMK